MSLFDAILAFALLKVLCKSEERKGTKIEWNTPRIDADYRRRSNPRWQCPTAMAMPTAELRARRCCKRCSVSGRSCEQSEGMTSPDGLFALLCRSLYSKRITGPVRCVERFSMWSEKTMSASGNGKSGSAAAAELYAQICGSM